MSDKPELKYQLTLTVNMTYLSNDVHDQSFYEMFSEILMDAQRAYPKYRFELDDMKTKEFD